MKEITDKDLAAIRSNLSACNPLVQSLVARLDRVEGEKDLEKKRYAAQCANLAEIGRDNFQSAGAVIDHLAGMVRDASAENTALRERVKRMEAALQFFALDPMLRATAQAALKEGE